MHRLNNIRRAAALALACFFITPALAQAPLKVFGYPYTSQYGEPVTIIGEVDATNGVLITHPMQFQNVIPPSTFNALGSPTLSFVRTQDALISLGQNHTCFVTSTGGAQCLGSSTHAQLGNGSTHASNPTTSPVDVTNHTASVNSVAAGLEHTCLLTNSGDVQCWGANYYGQSGNTTGLDRPTPAAVSGQTSIRMIDAGEGHTCSLSFNGAMSCWGWNAIGQLGIGSTSSSATPVTPTGLGSGVRQISVGNYHTCALLDGGTVKCWGWNHAGYVGNGTTQQQNAPVDVLNLTDAEAIVAGREHSCAITPTNVKCWGRGVSGQLGHGVSTNSSTPVTVSGLGGDIASIVAGDNFTCALSDTGDVSCWGGNTEGELGNGTNTLSNVPVSVTLGSPAIAISAGSYHACAVLESGEMKCWGNNSHGQLADGTTTDSNVPVTANGITPMLRYTASVVAQGGTALPVGLDLIEARVIDSGPPEVVRGFGALLVTVNKAETATTLVTDGTPVTVGATVTLTATVTSPSGSPEGTIEIFDGETSLGSGTTQNGVFALQTNSLAPGDHALTAVYQGDANFEGSTSSSLNQAVNRRSTTTDVTSSLNPSTFGASVTFSASVSATGGTPTGDVFFKAGATTLGTATIDEGVATLTTSALAVGTHTVTASYGGDTDHDRSLDTLDQVVGKASQTVSFTSTAPTSAVVGGTRYRPTATASSGLAPSFSIHATSVSVCSISAGFVSFSAVGTCRVVANQAGNASYNAAAAVTQTFSVARATVAVTLTAASPTVVRDSTVVLTADVNLVAPSTGQPTGLVTFRRNGVVFGSPVAVNASGIATITSEPLPLGNHVFVASFSTSTCCNADSSPTVTVAAGFAIGAEARVNTTTAGHQTNATVTSLGTGAVAVWEQRTTNTEAAIIAQRISQTGAKLGGEITVAALSPGAAAPQVAALDNGGFVVVWQEVTANGRDILMRRYSAAGAALAPETRANLNAAGEQAAAQVTAITGGYVVAWHSTGVDGSGTAVVFQRYNNSGVAQGGQVTVNTTTLGNQTAPALATLSTGGFVVAWSGQAGALYRVYARRFSAVGAPASAEMIVNASANAVVPPIIAVTGLLAGTYAIAYDQPETALATAPKDLFLRRYAANDTQAWIARANIAVSGSQLDPALVNLGTDGLAISWTTPDASGFAIDAQVFTAAGARVGTTFRVNTAVTGNQRQSDLANLGNDGYLAIWSSSGQDGDGDGIYMQRFVDP